MNKTTLPNIPIRFDAPVCYQVIVQGRLSEMVYPFFRDVHIEVKKNGGGIESTIMTGTVADQAALAGLLNMLYEFHYSILFVQYLNKNPS